LLVDQLAGLRLVELDGGCGLVCGPDDLVDGVRGLGACLRLAILEALLERHRQDVVVAVPGFQFRRQLGKGFAAAEHHLERAVVLGIDLHPIGEIALVTQLIEQTGGLACIAALFRGIALEAVNLLDHLDRNHDRVVFEAGDGLGIVQQHVRVENEGLLHHPRRNG
jgi:hypothetical protein